VRIVLQVQVRSRKSPKHPRESRRERRANPVARPCSVYIQYFTPVSTVPPSSVHTSNPPPVTACLDRQPAESKLPVRCLPRRRPLRGQHGMIKHMDPQICIHACALLYKLLVSSSSSSCSLYKLPESSSCSRSFCAQQASRISVESARRVSAARGHLPASLVSIVRIVLPVYESGQVPYHGSCHRHSYCYRGGSCCPALA
jgi:hypothetical protein